MASEEELERLRERRLAEMQSRKQQAEEIQRAREEAESQRQGFLRKILTPKARQRLNNIKLVRPDYAEQLEVRLIQLAQTRRIPLPIEDDFLKRLLAQLQSQQRGRDISIRRI